MSPLATALRRKRANLVVPLTTNAGAVVVSARSLRRWKAGQTPLPREMPALLAYLGQEPWPEPLNLSQQFHQARLRQGLSQAQAAIALGINAGTVWWWEAGRRPRRHDLKLRMQAFIDGPQADEASGDAAATQGDVKPALDLSIALRDRRRELGLTQEAAGVILGVDTWTVLGWENGGRKPMDRFYPALIRFLGVEPWPKPATIADQLRAERLRRGLSQEQAAVLIQVNRASIAGWEGGRLPRHRLSLKKIEAFVTGQVRPWRCGRVPTGRQAKAGNPHSVVHSPRTGAGAS